MTQIASGLTTTSALTTTQSPWRNRIHVLPDAYRAVLYSDGTNLLLRTSANGSVWSAATTLFALTGLSHTFDVAVVGNALHIVTTSGNSSMLYKLPYSGAGVFGALSAAQSIATQTSTILSHRLVYDATATVASATHTGTTTGVLHLLVDTGTKWTLYALDVNNSASGSAGVALLTSAVQTIVVSGPTSVTNGILSQANLLYFVTPGSTTWEGHTVTFAVSTTTGSSNGPATGQSAGMNSYWGEAITPGGSPVMFNGGGWMAVDGTVASSSPALNPPATANTVSTALGGYTIPTGTWSATFRTQEQNISSGTIQLEVRFWEKASNGSYTYRGKITGNPTSVVTGIDASGVFEYATLVASGAITGWTMATGSSLISETVFLNSQLWSKTNVSLSVVYPYNNSYAAQLSWPTPTIPTVVYVNTYTFGAAENPTIPISTYGAALCIADLTATPAIDIFVNGGTDVYTQQRFSAGGYSSPLPLTSSTTNTGIAGGVSCAFNATTGNEVVFYLAKATAGAFASGGTPHIASVARTSGVWGTPAIEDSSTSSLQNGWDSVAGKNLGQIGAAIVYEDGASPYEIVYEDAGWAASGGSNAPAATSVILQGATDVFGSVAPFITTNPNPQVHFVYTCGTLNDRLSSYDAVCAHSGTTDYDSGSIPVGVGPLPGQGYSFALGYTPTAYQTETLSINVRDTVTNAASNTAGTTTYIYVHTPVVRYDGTPLTSFSQALKVIYWHDKPYPCSAYQVRLLNGTTVALDSGVIFPATPVLPSTLNAQANIGDSSVIVNDAVANGTVIAIDVAGTTETRTVTGVTGTGPYTLGFTGPLTAVHAVGAQVGVVLSTPVQNLSGLNNATTYTVETTAFAHPSAGADFSSVTTTTITPALPAPGTPTNCIAYWVPGGDPLTGGYMRVRGTLPAGNGSSITDPTALDLYIRERGDTTWTLARSFAGVFAGTVDYRVFSVGNGKQYEFGLISRDANNSTSVLGFASSPDIEFQYGYWLNDPDNPSTCIELGIHVNVSTTGYFWEKEHVQEKDLITLFNRSEPVMTTGGLYALHSSTNPTFILEVGYEETSIALLRQWDRNGTVLLMRDVWGDVFFGSIITMKESAEQLPEYRSITIEFQQLHAAGNGVVVV